MKEILTDDGSMTFRSEEYDEPYHSKSGAVEEGFKKFAEPCKIAELAKKGEVNILDVCFGIGYNTAAAIDVALEANPDCKITVIGLENDWEILNKILEVNPEIKNYDILKELIENNKETSKQEKNQTIELQKNNITIKILVGDARETIKQITQTFDAVFLDPFSPKKCPELWTEEFFTDIKKVMKKGAMMATYSCARVVRDNLRNAGFEVKDGPIIGRRSPSTIVINN